MSSVVMNPASWFVLLIRKLACPCVLGGVRLDMIGVLHRTSFPRYCFNALSGLELGCDQRMGMVGIAILAVRHGESHT